MANNPDSMHQRQSAAKAGQGGEGKGGKDIQKMLGIEDEGPGTVDQKYPTKIMKLIMQSWGLDDDENEGEDKDE